MLPRRAAAGYFILFLQPDRKSSERLNRVGSCLVQGMMGNLPIYP